MGKDIYKLHQLDREALPIAAVPWHLLPDSEKSSPAHDGKGEGHRHGLHGSKDGQQGPQLSCLHSHTPLAVSVNTIGKGKGNLGSLSAITQKRDAARLERVD